MPLALPVFLAFLPVLWVLSTWGMKVTWEARHLSPRPRYGLATIIGSTLREVGSIWVLVWWHLTGRRHARVIEETSPDEPLVICLHGYMQNATNMHGVRRSLARAGIRSTSLPLGLPGRSLDVYTAHLERRLQPFRGRPLRFVCHSMGGIVLRQLLAEHPGWAAHVDAVVTIASPHEGTAAVKFGWLPETRALRFGSAFMRRLPPLSAFVPPERILSVGSPHDATVFPARTTHAGGATHLDFPGMGHSGLLVWSPVLRSITDWLKKVPMLAGVSDRS